MSILEERYASKEMATLFKNETKIKLFRQIWVALAEAEMKVGLPITQEQLKELICNKDKINIQKISNYEKKLKHDVMANIHAYGDLCQKAKGIIHLGATSALITDNADIVTMKRALDIIKTKLIILMKIMSSFAKTNKNVPCLSYTHLQAAQPTTFGKRACLWLYDLYLDYQALEYALDHLLPLGAKGTTGTQASFLKLVNGNNALVKKLDDIFVQKLGFNKSAPISGQTYPRKIDSIIANALSQIAVSASKFSYDIRLLCGFGETSEPFSKNQVGSSAMPYKNNPMLSERIGSLARLAISNLQSVNYTAATQWLERSLDDSAGRRIYIPQTFMLIDGILEIYIKIISDLKLNLNTIEKRLNTVLPFMLTEEILMQATKKGGNRQRLHEKIRKYSQKAKQEIEKNGINPLLEFLSKDSDFKLNKNQLKTLLDTKYLTGRASQQTEEFLSSHIKPILKKHKSIKITKSKVEI